MKIGLITTDVREFLKDYKNPTATFGAAPTALLQGFARIPDAEVHVISCSRQPMRSQQKLAENIWFHSLHVPKLGWLRTAYQGCIRAVRKILKEIQPDIVHGQGTELDCALDAVFSGFPNVITLHGNMIDAVRFESTSFNLFYWCAARLENMALKRTKGVLCNSRHTEALAIPRTRRTWLVPNPLRKGFLTTPPPPLRRSCPAKLLHVGAICENKQQIDALGVARALYERKVPVHVTFIGNIPAGDAYGEAFLEAVKKAEKAGYANYLQHQSVEELVSTFDRGDALLHTPKAEAFGLVVAEALARNLQVFTFRVGGLPDIVSGVPNAALLPPNDWDGLRQQVENWVAAETPRQGESVELMRERYEPLMIAQRHIEIYREVLARS